MKLNSDHLNPFQAFPERQLDSTEEECPGSAIENNLSRSVFSALANAEHPCVLATFLQVLGRHGSAALRERIEAIAETLRNTDPGKVEFGLQTWPAAAMREREGLQVILIGISSSHEGDWTHDQRFAPEDPCPDAWIYVPGEMLLVFECKNDEHPLDATQISAYAHALGLLTAMDCVPRAEPGGFLESATKAEDVQNACRDLVLDASWSTVADALNQFQQEECVGDLGRWLCGKAAEYIEWHIYPPYRGSRTILDWLKGPDTADRRNHLRKLVRKMGDELANAAQGVQGAITFAKDKKDRWDLRHGAGSAVYVKLTRDGASLKLDWPGRMVNPVLWFRFAEDENQRIGLDYYLQASGSQPNGKGEAAWNDASVRHRACAEPFEELVAAWCRNAPASTRMIVSAVCFRGKKRNWHGGGVEVPNGPNSSETMPEGALAFLRAHREELWRFPRVGPGEAVATIEDAAPQVRKPDLSLLFPLETHALAACGEEGQALQELLKTAVAGITTKVVAGMGASHRDGAASRTAVVL